MAQEVGHQDRHKGGLRGVRHEMLEKVESGEGHERLKTGMMEGVSDKVIQLWGWVVEGGCYAQAWRMARLELF